MKRKKWTEKEQMSLTEPAKPRSVQRVAGAQPDQDFEALKACCKAIETCSCPRMVKATLDFLNSKYAPPGVL